MTNLVKCVAFLFGCYFSQALRHFRIGLVDLMTDFFEVYPIFMQIFGYFCTLVSLFLIITRIFTWILHGFGNGFRDSFDILAKIQ